MNCPSENYRNNDTGTKREQKHKVGDRIWVSVKEEHKNIFTPENIHNFSGFIWQIDDEHVYVKSSSGALNRYPWWAIDYKTDNDIEQPEPEPDDRIREAFEKDFAKLYPVWNKEKDAYCDSITQYVYEGFKSCYTSRNAEIDALKSRLMASEGAVKMLNDMDDENQKTIQSLRCCGNCDNIRATPQDHDFCWNNNGNLPSERICDNWTRKTK